MRYTIPYGDSDLGFDLPESSVLFDGQMVSLPEIPDLPRSLSAALDDPTGTPPLREMIRGRRKILFLVEDATRSTPLRAMLPEIIKYLGGCGITDDCIAFLTAPGTHRVMTKAEISEKLGEETVRRFRIYQHDATALEDLADIGTVMAGDLPVPAHINKKVLEADFIIGLGNIVPHCDAGYSGGAKILQPGVCGFVTTAATHAAAAFCSDIPLGMKEGNPCRIGMEAVASKVGLSFIINVVKNCGGGVCGVFAGDFIKAHRKGAEMSEQSFKVDIPRPADIVIASSHPADLDYWQASKGVLSAYFAVAPGGIIIWASPCHEGLAANHPRLKEWLIKPLDVILKDLRATPFEDEEADLVSAVIASCNSRAREKASIYAVTSLSGEDLSALGYRSFASIQDALDSALETIPNASVGILPHAGITLPVQKS
jgi:nickel-dependent lactate racemase